MKKIFAILGLSALAISPVMAEYRCFPLSTFVGCTNNSEKSEGTAEWSLTCTSAIDGKTSVSVSGVAACVSNEYSKSASAGTIITSPVYAGDAASNTSCVCKMTAPASSGFVFAQTIEKDCAVTCAQACASAAVSGKDVTSALLTNLS